MLLGLVGVALWPLHAAGLLETYPLAAHLRFMIHGFLASFVFGFLFTAAPRLLSCPRPPALITALFLAATLAEAVLLAFHRIADADIVFLAQLLATLLLAAIGWARRADLPPPGFALGAAGLLSALVGSLLLFQESLGHASATSYALSRILLFQAFPALPLVGIGAFFFPKLSGGPDLHNFPENLRPTPAWLRRFWPAATTIALFALSVWLELRSQPQLAYLLRATVLGADLDLETPIFKPTPIPGSQQRLLQLCSIALVASFAAMAFFPLYRTAWLHLFFIVAVTGSILLVATRVVFSHSGNTILSIRTSKPLLWAVALLITAALLRLASDLAPTLRSPLQIAAALAWLLVATTWLLKVAPSTRTPDPDDTP